MLLLLGGVWRTLVLVVAVVAAAAVVVVTRTVTGFDMSGGVGVVTAVASCGAAVVVVAAIPAVRRRQSVLSTGAGIVRWGGRGSCLPVALTLSPLVGLHLFRFERDKSSREVNKCHISDMVIPIHSQACYKYLLILQHKLAAAGLLSYWVDPKYVHRLFFEALKKTFRDLTETCLFENHPPQL